MAFHEQHSRSVVKALTYRFLIVLSDSIVVYFLTKRFDLTAGFIATTSIINTILYFAHERAWNSIHWGKADIKK